MFVHNYEVSILKEGVRESDAATWTISQEKLISDIDEKQNQVALKGFKMLCEVF